MVSGAWTREKAQAEFIKSWDTNKDNRIEKDEFFNYFEWVSAGIDSADYFELVIRNVREYCIAGCGWGVGVGVGVGGGGEGVGVLPTPCTRALTGG